MILQIVSLDLVYPEAVSILAKGFGFADVVISTHEKALEVFLEKEPTHILVLEYEEGVKGGKFLVGQHTWADLTASAMPDQKFVRMGFMSCDAADFLRLPATGDQIRQALLG